MSKQHGIILPISLCDRKSELKVNELVEIDGLYYNLEKINPRYLIKDENEPDNEYMYIVKDKVTGGEMNFKRDEMNKSFYGVFDLEKYNNQKIKVKLGELFPSDLRNIKAKYILENDLSLDIIDDVKIADILFLEITGEVVSKQYENIYSDEAPTLVKYFKVG